MLIHKHIYLITSTQYMHAWAKFLRQSLLHKSLFMCLTQDEEINCHFTMAIKTHACSLLNLWMILLYISNWPREANGHYGILQQDIFVNRSVLWETITLITLGTAIGLHQMWQLERAREGGSCTTNPADEYFHQIESNYNINRMIWKSFLDAWIFIQPTYKMNIQNVGKVEQQL